MRAKRESRWISPPTAAASFIASVTAWRLVTGRVPGKPRQTGQVAELAGAFTVTGLEQKSFDRVCSCACTSSPMTGKTRVLSTVSSEDTTKL